MHYSRTAGCGTESGIKKILVLLDSNPVVGTFDAIMAYDAGIGCVLPLTGVSALNAAAIVHETVFARPAKDLDHLALFIGGSSMAQGEAILRAVESAFFDRMRVSVMLDSNGSNTTAAAIVAKVISTCDVSAERVVVLAGTGPVGMRTAALLARQNAQVTLASRDLARAKAACDAIRERFGLEIQAAEAPDATAAGRLLVGASVVVTTGAPGVMLLRQAEWGVCPTLRVLADVNAVPPFGIEGVDPSWDGERSGGLAVFGALGIGRLKKQVHYACLRKLFERNDHVLDAEQIFDVAWSMERECAS